MTVSNGENQLVDLPRIYCQLTSNTINQTICGQGLKNVCELCGNKTKDIRMHHIKSLKSIKRDSKWNKRILAKRAGRRLQSAQTVHTRYATIIFAILRDNKPFKIITPQEYTRQYHAAKCGLVT